MPAHTPAPTFARSVYGLFAYVACRALFALYACWALAPDAWLRAAGLDYYPQKYWAVAAPAQLLVALALFAFLVYPSLGLTMTPDRESPSTAEDEYSLRPPAEMPKREEMERNSKGATPFCDCKNKENCKAAEFYADEDESSGTMIPSVYDMDVGYVSRVLYSNDDY